MDIWLEETLQQEEIEVTSRLDRSRALVRIGPMLGLAGTIIPLGPALQALLGGDMAAIGIPKWLKAIQASGYAGAREMFKEMEHLYGFQATSAEQMNGTFWQNSFDVFVRDKYGLDMQQFFEKSNPHAEQWILSRMLEVDRQGSYKFSIEDRAMLMRKYVQSVNRYGVTCFANTCGNLRVHQFVAAQAALVSGLGSQELHECGEKLAHATGWKPKGFRGAPSSFLTGVARPNANLTKRVAYNSPPKPATTHHVSGYRLREQTLGTSSASLNAVTSGGIIAVAVLLGALYEFRRSKMCR